MSNLQSHSVIFIPAAEYFQRNSTLPQYVEKTDNGKTVLDLYTPQYMTGYIGNVCNGDDIVPVIAINCDEKDLISETVKRYRKNLIDTIKAEVTHDDLDANSPIVTEYKFVVQIDTMLDDVMKQEMPSEELMDQLRSNTSMTALTQEDVFFLSGVSVPVLL